MLLLCQSGVVVCPFLWCPFSYRCGELHDFVLDASLKAFGSQRETDRFLTTIVVQQMLPTCETAVSLLCVLWRGAAASGGLMWRLAQRKVLFLCYSTHQWSEADNLALSVRCPLNTPPLSLSSAQKVLDAIWTSDAAPLRSLMW